MHQTEEQRRAKLVALMEAEIDQLLQWEKQTQGPNLTQIEEVVLSARQRLGEALGNDLVQAQADQLEKQPGLAVEKDGLRPLRSKGKKKGTS